MPGSSSKRPSMDNTIELSQREILALKYIVEFQKTDKFHRPPSHRGLIEHLNAVLPKSSSGGPAISSTVQTYRIATKLRIKGFLLQIDDSDPIKSRNLVATPAGERFIRSYGWPAQPNRH